MKQLSANVYGILNMMGLLNYYVITSGDSLTLVDTGTDKSIVSRLEKAFAEKGWSLDQIQAILITHAHYDHTGGLPAIQSRINATTYAHRLDAPIVRGEQEAIFPPKDQLTGLPRLMATSFSPPQATPARVDIELQEDDTLDSLYPGLQVIHLPGHSYGQVGFWHPEERWLIGGDVMMRLPWGLSVPLKSVSPDWAAVKDSIRLVASMPVETLCLGHGQPIISGAAAQIKKLADRLSK